MSLLTVEDVHTYYGKSHILEGVSLAVDRGEVVALVGRNGVGKTTTLRTIIQLSPPRSGRVTFDGRDLTGLDTHAVAQAGIGWIPEDRRIFDQLTVEENLRVALPPSTTIADGLSVAYETFPDLQEHQNRNGGDLSGGQQQMLAVARGLIGDNELLLIDEPSEGLAPLIVKRVSKALARAAKESTVLLVEQNLGLALDLADRFYVLDTGQIVDSGTTAGLSADSERFRRYVLA
ncbi:ABC transporter ATP-binding protein [Halocatena halophila]|uniref:ABC transporter ATP-binding protein n=1 Tax=Halocatena halophila TaxID=2814576 RepID=UPI002ED5B284